MRGERKEEGNKDQIQEKAKSKRRRGPIARDTSGQSIEKDGQTPPFTLKQEKRESDKREG